MADDPQRNKKILLGIMLIGGLGYLGFEYLYTPRAEEIATLERRLETLETQNRTARILTEADGRDDVERRLASYRDQLAQVEGLIPSSEELPDLLDAISMESQRTGVDLTLIQPTGAQVEEFYTRRTYQLAALGSYHQMGEFLTRIASLPRIITPTNLSLRVQRDEGRGGDPQLEARFAIETYVLPSNLAEANGHEAE
jgi:type IV pilus assembly protein PilO